MDKSQLFINELKNIFIMIQRENEQAASVPALPDAKQVYAEKSLTIAFSDEVFKAFEECIKKYRRKFDKDGTSKSQLLRILCFNFIENWETMPMEKAWNVEKNRNFTISSGVRRKMRLTVSGI